MQNVKLKTRVIKRVRSVDGVVIYYWFLTLMIGIAAGFSFAYILFVCTVPTNNPLQIFRRSLRTLENHRIVTLSKPRNDENVNHEENRRLADELAKKVRVLCWVMTQPLNHQAKAIHVKATWGKRCNKLLFISSTEDKNLPSLNPEIENEGRYYLWGKTRAAFHYIYEHHRDDADWFLKADDDTYVIVDNLRYMLADYNSNFPMYFGCRFKNFTPEGYMSGGAGYVLSREALNRFATHAMSEPKICRSYDIGVEDVEMAKCLYRVGVQAMDSRDERNRSRFLPFRPEDHLFNSMPTSHWYWKYIFYPVNVDLAFSTCCSDYAVTFHNVHPGLMYTFEYFLYHLRSYGFRHGSDPLPQILKTPHEVDSSEVEHAWKGGNN